MFPSDPSRGRWRYQPTQRFHSPNPPITIKSPVVAGRTTKNTDPQTLGQYSGISRTILNPFLGIWSDAMR